MAELSAEVLTIDSFTLSIFLRDELQNTDVFSGLFDMHSRI
jgi:hypothetical protein